MQKLEYMEIPKNQKTFYISIMRFFRFSRRKIIFSAILAILAFISILVGCGQKDNSKETYPFKHSWFWMEGASDGSMPATLESGDGFQLLQVAAEEDLSSLLTDEKGYIWVRSEFFVPVHGFSRSHTDLIPDLSLLPV